MNIRKYTTTIDICLEPVWTSDPPAVVLQVGDKIVRTALTKISTFSFELDQEPGQYFIKLDFNNKSNEDSLNGNDKAIIIKDVIVNGIASKYFIWNGKYTPTYPEPWYSQQIIKPDPVLTNTNYLGWNGTWVLEYSVPVFTWIHHTENLGWIYGE